MADAPTGLDFSREQAILCICSTQVPGFPDLFQLPLQGCTSCRWHRQVFAGMSREALSATDMQCPWCAAYTYALKQEICQESLLASAGRRCPTGRGPPVLRLAAI